MFGDLDLNKDLNDKFHKHLADTAASEATQPAGGGDDGRGGGGRLSGGVDGGGGEGGGGAAAAGAAAGAVVALAGSVEMDVRVLTVGHWPAYPATTVHLPKPLAEAASVFERYYAKVFAGRRLAWAHGLGHCVLKAHFPKVLGK
jgi:hypothetical protein